MFDRLRDVLTSIKKTFTTRTIDERIIDEIFSRFEIELMESDLSLDVIEDVRERLKGKILGEKVERGEIGEFIEKVLREVLEEILVEPEKPLEALIDAKRKDAEKPFVIVFLGINGTGKTTTIAKVGKLLDDKGFRVLLAAADTYRAGAIEQLEVHAKRVGLRVISQRYGADAAAVARDAIEHAKSNNYDTVLVDTAGRMQTNKNLLEELAKIVRVSRSDMNIFVGDALSGNDIVNQAKMFMEKPGFEGSILTKVDADVKGGSIINVAWASGKPIFYLGVGQNYDDLIQFSKKWVIERVLGQP